MLAQTVVLRFELSARMANVGRRVDRWRDEHIISCSMRVYIPRLYVKSNVSKIKMRKMYEEFAQF